MWPELIAGGLLVFEYIYHRVTDKSDHEKPIREIQIARTDEGAPVPIIYGLCRVDAPILAWTGTPASAFTTAAVGGDEESAGPGAYVYMLDQYFILGIPVNRGTSVSRINSIYVGPFSLLIRIEGGRPNVSDLSELNGLGEYERVDRYCVIWNDAHENRKPYVYGEIEYLSGVVAQRLVDQLTLDPTTLTGQRMIENGVDPTHIPGYRGYMSVLFTKSEVFENNGFDEYTGFVVGTDPQPPDFSFEVSSYPHPQYSLTGQSTVDGVEMNPADVILDLLMCKFAKLGISSGDIDRDTFVICANKLQLETHGYSRAFQDVQDASEMLNEVLEQIDGLIYVDPTTGKICLRLIRADYDTFNVPKFNPANAVMINYSGSGWANIVNKIRVVYADRQLKYQEDSVTAHNQASAVDQDGAPQELTLRYPGCHTKTLAMTIAAREISARSRPMAKCSIEVSRAFYRTVPGDVVSVTWPEFGVSGLLFRVFNVDRGSLSNGRIRLDLIQEYFHTYTGTVAPPDGITPHPGQDPSTSG